MPKIHLNSSASICRSKKNLRSLTLTIREGNETGMEEYGRSRGREGKVGKKVRGKKGGKGKGKRGGEFTGGKGNWR